MFHKSFGSHNLRVGWPRRIRITPPGEAAEEQRLSGDDQYNKTNNKSMTFIGRLDHYLAGNSCLAPTSFSRKPALHGLMRSTRTDSPRQDWPEQFSAKRGGGAGAGFWRGEGAATLRIGRNNFRRREAAAPAPAFGEERGRPHLGLGDGFGSGPTGSGPTDEHSVHPHHRDFIVTPIADQIGPIDSISKTEYYDLKNDFSEPQCKMTVLPFNIGKSRFDPCITVSAYKNQLVVVSVQYGPFNPYIPIRSTTIGKSRVAIDPIAMRTSWRSNSDIASVTSIGYPRMSASGESSTTMHRPLHASGSHPIPPPDDPKTNQYNQDLGLIHSTNGNHLESPNEGSSIEHQVTIYLHAQNITMFPTNETWYFASQILVSSSGGLILILTAQSTRNMFRIHSDY
ncbi:hypothetical protein F511_36212 [Dorcoceras hygrometricum]|uniref:Uncharacterized protein n=1 Tax=Dorcoceras hygrometricum TaxID=472368 RepID=A0A2Z7C6U7_9LAMI|nr:hypothetical protein F511_36212 [Dorcoceras hygrometricum]